MDPEKDKVIKIQETEVAQIQEHVKTSDSATLEKEFNDVQIDFEGLKNELNREKIIKEKLNFEPYIPKELKDTREKSAKIASMTKVLAQTIWSIKEGKIKLPSAPDQANTDIIQQLVTTYIVDLKTITDRNAIYLNVLFKKGLNNELNSLPNLIKTFEDISSLQYLDENEYNRIAKILQRTAKEKLGATEKDIESLKTAKQKKEEVNNKSDTRNKQEEIRKRIDNLQTEAKSIVFGITANRLRGTVYENEVRRNLNIDKYSKFTKEQIEDMVTAGLERKVDAIQQSIMSQLMHMGLEVEYDFGEKDSETGGYKKNYRPVSSEEIQSRLSTLENYLVKISDEGVFQGNELSDLQTKVQEAAALGKTRANYFTSEMAGQGLYQRLEYSVGSIWDKKQVEIINLLDSEKTFPELMKKYNNFADPIKDWDDFTRDIRGIFERLFDFAEIRPNDFWQESFNPMYEDHAYKMLVMALRQLGRSIKQTGLGDQKVKVEDFFYKQELSKFVDKSARPKSRLVDIRYKEVDIASALSNILADEMITLKDLTEYLHNVNVISQLGMGFEELAKYSGRLRLEQIVWLFRSTKGLSEAYNSYLQNTHQFLSINNHVLTPDFGMLDNTEKLDPVEKMTFAQLLGKESAILKDMTKSDDINRKRAERLKRLIRLASGISKGVTGEWWSLAYTTRMPIEGDGAIVKDAKGNWCRKYETKRTFSSTGNSGPEKMWTSINMDLTMQRFNIPQYWPSIRFLFAPRDLNHSSKEIINFHHRDIYKIADWEESAQFGGRCDELADFDEDNVCLMDKTRTNNIDYFLRGGWRFYEYRNFLIYKRNGDEFEVTPEGKMTVNFEATIANLQGMGPYLVKRFIDDVKSGDVKADLKITTDKEVEDNYQKYIFDNLIDTRPSSFISMETLRWMPNNEQPIVDELLNKLISIYGKDAPQNFISTLLPIYVGAMEIVENYRLGKAKKDWKQMWDNDPNRFEGKNKNPFQYKLILDDFERPEIKEALLAYYKYYKTDIGEVNFRQQGNKKVFEDQDFIDNVKEFYKALDNSIHRTRWKRVDHIKGEETLSERYAHFLRKKIGNVEIYIKGNLTDMSELFLQQAGNRPPERMMGEVFKDVEGMTPNMQAILFDALPRFAAQNYENYHAMEEAAVKVFAEPLNKIVAAISNASTEDAYNIAAYWLTFISEAVAEDRMTRWKVVGEGMMDWKRRRFGEQRSFMADHIPEAIDHPVAHVDSTGIYHLIHSVGEAIKMPREPHDIIGYEKKLGGLYYKPITHENKNSIEQLIHANGVTLTRRALESSPLIGPIMFLILAMLAKLALDKDKKK